MATRNTVLKGVKTLMAIAAFAMAQPALANKIELNSFWAGSGAVKLKYSGTVWYSGQTVSNYSAAGGSGGFKTYDLTTDPGRTSPFQTFCVDIFHDFNFVVDSIDYAPTPTPTGLGSAALLNLGRLYTSYGSYISSTSSAGVYEAAFQDAIWAIVNDGEAINSAGIFDLASGQPLILAPYYSSDATSIALAQNWLNSLAGTMSQYDAQFLMVQNQGAVGTQGAQDVVYFAPTSPVPEPGTYDMMLGGLGLIGFIAYRRKKSRQHPVVGLA